MTRFTQMSVYFLWCSLSITLCIYLKEWTMFRTNVTNNETHILCPVYHTKIMQQNGRYAYLPEIVYWIFNFQVCENWNFVSDLYTTWIPQTGCMEKQRYRFLCICRKSVYKGEYRPFIRLLILLQDFSLSRIRST